jgi:amino-acid N-acetyltransferase
MSQSIEERMLEALELFQYSFRFRNELFVVACPCDSWLDRIHDDLRVLQSSHISVIIVTPNSEKLSQAINRCNQRGQHYVEFEVPNSKIDHELVTKLRPYLEKDEVPVVSLPPETQDTKEEISVDNLLSVAMSCAEKLDAKKVFYLSSGVGLEVDGKFRSHVSVNELASMINGSNELTIPVEVLSFIHSNCIEHGIEFVILPHATGSLFQEIFTHQGKGTLFTDDYPNIIREGRLTDVHAILTLIKPYVLNGTILPVTEDEIAEDIGQFFVYTINEAIVASVKIVDYGDEIELAKFCTLPRFQGKGRARQLARLALKRAKELDKKTAFSLSTEPKMWDFFCSLGFSEIAREQLPDAWRKNYNLERPSKAFKYSLKD